MSEPFDLERLRQAWNRTEPEGPPAPLHPRLDGVGPAVDPHREALSALDRAERLALERLPSRAAAVTSALSEARELLAAVKAAPEGEGAAPLAAYLAALDRFEDLLEAFRLADAARSR
jgi:hypothetical protein